MIRKCLLAVLLATQCSATIYDVDKSYQDDYDDAWETEPEAVYKNQQHHFKHINVVPTEKPDATFLERIKREAENIQEDYEDAWLYTVEEREDKLVVQKEEVDQVPLVDREASAVIENPATSTRYSLGKTLEPGDVIEVHATYSGSTGWYSLNLMSEDRNILLHVNHRPNYDQTVMNNEISRRWQSAIKCEAPELQSGKDFVVKIAMFDDFYKILFNGDPLSKTFPYRNDLSLVKYLEFRGGTNGFTWNKIVMPGEHKFDGYLKAKAMEETLANLQQRISDNVIDRSIDMVKQYANSTEGTLDIFQWRLLKIIHDKGDNVDFNDETLTWILSDCKILEMFMTSGDVKNNEYKKALMILIELITEDPQIKTEPLRMRLAVATALTFSNHVHVFSVPRNKIDWMARYKLYLKLSDDGVIYTQFYMGTAWHLRYVVGSLQTEAEHAWARANTPEGYDDPENVPNSCHAMISYKLHNDDGISVHTPNYYYKLPVTMKAIHEIGGVCGAISNFAAGMAHAYGVPALPVTQPGHCAFMWYTTEDKWELGNSVSGWANTNTHSRMQYSWMRPAYYFPVMNHAQGNLAEYRLSEKMRIATKMARSKDRFGILEDASTVCPHNFAVWVDLEDALEAPDLDKAVVQSTLLPYLQESRKSHKQESVISLKANTTSECFSSAMQLTDGSGVTAYCREETADLVLDFERLATINSIKFRWWGWSKPAQYDMYAMDKNGEYVLVKTQADERVEGWFNHYSYLDGWDMKTYKIKIDMRNGKLDPWDYGAYFGIRALIVKGILHDVIGEVSNNKPVTSSEISTGAANLVDQDETTLWMANADNSWFEINLKAICAMDDIEFSWVTQPDEIKVYYKVGNGSETEVAGEEPFNKLLLDMDTGVTVKVTMKGGNAVLKGIKVCGIEYSSKDILKMKVEAAYGEYYNVRNDITTSIDEWAYTD